MKKKFYIILFGVLLMVILAGTASFIAIYRNKLIPQEQDQVGLTPKDKISDDQNSTVDWLTYTDSKYNFEIKYPKGASISSEKNHVNSVMFGLEGFLEIPTGKIITNKLNSDIPLLSIIILSSANIEHLSLDEWINNVVLAQQKTGEPYPDEIKKISIDNTPAYYLLYTSEARSFGYEEYAAVHIYLEHNNNFYSVSGIKVPSEIAEGLKKNEAYLEYLQYVKQYEIIFDKMVASFKFTD